MLAASLVEVPVVAATEAAARRGEARARRHCGLRLGEPARIRGWAPCWTKEGALRRGVAAGARGAVQAPRRPPPWKPSSRRKSRAPLRRMGGRGAGSALGCLIARRSAPARVERRERRGRLDLVGFIGRATAWVQRDDERTFARCRGVRPREPADVAPPRSFDEIHVVPAAGGRHSPLFGFAMAYTFLLATRRPPPPRHRPWWWRRRRRHGLASSVRRAAAFNSQTAPFPPAAAASARRRRAAAMQAHMSAARCDSRRRCRRGDDQLVFWSRELYNASSASQQLVRSSCGSVVVWRRRRRTL